MGCNQYERQKLPVDYGSGFSGYLVLGDTRIDLTTGNIYNLTGSGIISGFIGLGGGTSGYSGFSGFSGIGGTGVQEIQVENVFYNPLYATPEVESVGRINVLSFSPTVQNAVNFSVEIPEDIVLGNNLALNIDYDMSTSEAKDVRLVLAYDVIDNNGDTIPAIPTRTISATVTTPATAQRKAEYAFVIPAVDVTSITDSIRFTLLRDATSLLDTHDGKFRAGAITLRYLGLGGPASSAGSGSASGASGTSGFSGTGYSGPSGPSGPSGTSGFSGAGYSGPSGTSGFSGTGYSGPSGTSGFSGTGYSGPSGPSGPSGTSGFSGTGYSGPSGTSGFSGTGYSGPSGPSGPSGTSGFSGTGYSGPSGTSGFSGTGYSGPSGPSGPSGTSGFSGTGYSGPSGASGFSGSGTSGFSGAGTSGFSGISAVTRTTAQFTTPSVGNTVPISVVDSSGFLTGQVIYIEGAGYYQVSSIPGGTTLVVENLGYPGNTAPFTVIPSGAGVSPGGPIGPSGFSSYSGDSGFSGVSAVAITTAQFTVPSVGGSVSVSVNSSAGFVAGQIIYIEGAGSYEITSIPDGTTLVVENLGYPGNAAPSIVIPPGKQVVPSGPMGVSGFSGAGSGDDAFTWFMSGN